MEVPHSDADEARNVLWDTIGSQLTLVDYGGPRPLVGGKWEIERVLGRGGFGLVCAARDLTLPRRVAIKLLPQGPEMTSLMREARSLALLEHPAIVTIFEVDEGLAVCGERSIQCGWIAMQLIDGDTLEGWVTRTRPRASRVIEVVTSAGRAIAHAHAKGVLHRDLKPTNIMLDTRGRTYVIDFGLAIAPLPAAAANRTPGKSGDSDALGTRATVTGTIRGTPRYMAPEMSSQPRAASDQFSLAVVAWEALTGVHPWDAQHTRGSATPRIDPRIWERIKPVLQRGMAGVPSARFESMEVFCSELQSAAKGLRRRRLTLLGFAAFFLVGIALETAYWAGTRSSPESPGNKAMVSSGRATGECDGLGAWAGHWSLTGKIVWTEYSNQLVQIRPMNADLVLLDNCDVELRMDKFLPASTNKPDGFVSGTTQVTPTRLGDESWSLVYDIGFPGDRRTYGKDEHQQLALTLDRSSDGEPGIHGAFRKVQTGSGLVLRKGWVLGSKSGSPTLAEVGAHEYPCDARCRVYCAGAEATSACIERGCTPYTEPLSDPCGPPSIDFTTPLRTRAERRHFLKGRAFGAVHAGKPGDCEANATRIAGRWWVWRVTEHGPELSRVDVVPHGCQLRATLRGVGTTQRISMEGEITEMGIWYLARDPLEPVHPDTLILAGTGPAFGIDMATPGRILRGFRP